MTWIRITVLALFFSAPFLLVLMYSFGGQMFSWMKSQWNDPHWVLENVVIALLVGLVVGLAVALIQRDIDDDRSRREIDIADQQNKRDHEISAAQEAAATRLENLRYVRERASREPQLRPFASFDLTGMDLVGLELAGADLSLANLTHANLTRANLGVIDTAQLPPDSRPLNGISNASVLMGANLCKAVLRSTQLNGAFLNEANFAGVDLRLTNLAGAILFGADLSEAKLPPPESAFLMGIVHDTATEWPPGYQPPKSAADPMARLAWGFIEMLIGDYATPNCPPGA